jgi:hypothetical protein
MDADFVSREPQKQDLAIGVLRATGKVRFAARGYSMLPTLWPGDLLTVATIPFEEVCPGDVVLYRRWERFFIHRVLRKSRGAGSDRPSLVTRGDSMSGYDAAVLPEELLGTVISVERASGPSMRVPACSVIGRMIGLALGYSDRLRGVVLRWHGWRTRHADAKVSANPMRTGQTLG